jgi:GntR family transcriptional regulator
VKLFVNTRSGVPIYKQLVQQIEKGVIGEILKPGDQLPTVREVALELTVNPNTVARAYRELEHRGIIESFQGRGTFIAGSVRPPLAAEKELLIKQQLDELLQEARQLNIKPADLKRIFEIALKQWEKTCYEK